MLIKSDRQQKADQQNTHNLNYFYMMKICNEERSVSNSIIGFYIITIRNSWIYLFCEPNSISHNLMRKRDILN